MPDYFEGYRKGFQDGLIASTAKKISDVPVYKGKPKTKRKLSAWNKFIKANAKKPRFRLRSGSPNLKKLAVAFRKTPAGKKKRR